MPVEAVAIIQPSRVTQPPLGTAGVPALLSQAAEGVPAAAFATLHACSVGGEAFQLDDFGYRQEPIIRYGATIGAKLTGQGEGWVEAADAGSLAAALSIAAASFQVAGVDFSVYGLGGQELLTISAAECILGGPHISFELMPAATEPALIRRFRFTVSADTASADGIPRLATDTTSDNLRVITWSGELFGGAAGDRPVGEQYQALVNTFAGQYPFPYWVHTQRLEVAATQDQATFNLQATQLAAPLPGGGSGATVVDGEGQENTINRDEQMRLTRIFSFDLIVVGDPQQVINSLRSLVQAQISSPTVQVSGTSAGVILREQTSVSLNRHVHVKATFESLEGGNGNALMNWSQTFRRTDKQDVWDMKTYPGILPTLVKVPHVFRKLYQSGSATGAGQYPRPPAPLYPNQLADQPDINYQSINGVECQTGWSYAMWMDDETKLDITQLMRPKKPQFEPNRLAQ